MDYYTVGFIFLIFTIVINRSFIPEFKKTNENELHIQLLFLIVLNCFWNKLNKLPRLQDCIIFKFSLIKLYNIILLKNWENDPKTIVTIHIIKKIEGKNEPKKY